MSKSKSKQPQSQSSPLNTPPPPASDITVRLKLAAGDENTPRDIRELAKDAVDSIRSLRERVRFLEKMARQQASRGTRASIVSEIDPASEGDLVFERPTGRCRANAKLNPQNHEGIDFP